MTAFLRMAYLKAKLRLRFAIRNIGYPLKDSALYGNLRL